MERLKPVSLRASNAAIDDIAEEEGLVLYAYDDAEPRYPKTPITPENAHTVRGTLTIGAGRTTNVKPGDTCTREQARVWLRTDVREAESCVHRFVHVPLTQGEFDGMTDLFFNVGPGRKKGSLSPEDPGRNGIAVLGKEEGCPPSTLLRHLNAGDYAAAATCFTQWRSAGTPFEKTLLRRRIRFKLRFLGLPATRALLKYPNVLPATVKGIADLVEYLVAAAREEAADQAVTTPAAPVAPAKPAEPVPDGAVAIEDELVLETPPKPAPPPPAPPAPPPVTRPPPPPPPPSVRVDTAQDMGPGLKNMFRSKRFYGGLLIVVGRVVIVLDASGHFAEPVRQLIGDGVLMDWTTGLLVNIVGEALFDRGEKKAELPLGTPKEVALMTQPPVRP